jgi:hypothetical protein
MYDIHVDFMPHSINPSSYPYNYFKILHAAGAEAMMDKSNRLTSSTSTAPRFL